MKGKKNSIVALSSKLVKADRKSRADEVFALPVFPEASTTQSMPARVETPCNSVVENPAQAIAECQTEKFCKPIATVEHNHEETQVSVEIDSAQAKQISLHDDAQIKRDHQADQSCLVREPGQIQKATLQHGPTVMEKVHELHQLPQVQQSVMTMMQTTPITQPLLGFPPSVVLATCNVDPLQPREAEKMEGLQDCVQQQCFLNNITKLEQQQAFSPFILSQVPKNSQLLKPKHENVIRRTFDLELPAEAYIEEEAEEVCNQVNTCIKQDRSVLGMSMDHENGVAAYNKEWKSLRSQGALYKEDGSENHSKQHPASFGISDMGVFPANEICNQTNTCIKQDSCVAGISMNHQDSMTAHHKEFNTLTSQALLPKGEGLEKHSKLHPASLGRSDACVFGSGMHSTYRHGTTFLTKPYVEGVTGSNHETVKFLHQEASRMFADYVPSAPQILHFGGSVPMLSAKEPIDVIDQQEGVCISLQSRLNRDARALSYPYPDTQPLAVPNQRVMESHPGRNLCGTAACSNLQLQQDNFCHNSAKDQERSVLHATSISQKSPLGVSSTVWPWLFSSGAQSDSHGPMQHPHSSNFSISERVDISSVTDLTLGFPSNTEVLSRVKEVRTIGDGMPHLHNKFEQAGQNRVAHKLMHGGFVHNCEENVQNFRSTTATDIFSGQPPAKVLWGENNYIDTFDPERMRTIDPHSFHHTRDQLECQNKVFSQKNASNWPLWLFSAENKLAKDSSINKSSYEKSKEMYKCKEEEMIPFEMPDQIIYHIPCNDTRKQGAVESGVRIGLSHGEAIIRSSSMESKKYSAIVGFEQGDASETCASHAPHNGHTKDAYGELARMNEDEVSDVSNQGVETLLSLNNMPLHFGNKILPNKGMHFMRTAMRSPLHHSYEDDEVSLHRNSPFVNSRKRSSDKVWTATEYRANKQFFNMPSLAMQKMFDSSPSIHHDLTMGIVADQNGAIAQDSSELSGFGSVHDSTNMTGKVDVHNNRFYWDESTQGRAC